MRKIFLVCLISAGYLLAQNAEVNTNEESSMKNDKTLSTKKSNENKSGNRVNNTSGNSSSSESRMVIDPVSIYYRYTKDCVVNHKTAADFGLTSEMDDGRFDMYQQQLIDATAKNSLPIERAGGDSKQMKEYLACVVDESARMAQANIILTNSIGSKNFNSSMVDRDAYQAWQSAAKITDKNIAKQLELAHQALNGQCRFFGSTDRVQCGGLTFELTDNVIKLGNLMLTSHEKFFGISTNISYGKSANIGTTSDAYTESGKTKTTEASMSKSKSSSTSRGSKTKMDTSAAVKE